MLPLFPKVNATGAFRTIVYHYFHWKGKCNFPIAPGQWIVTCKIVVLPMAWVTCFSQEKAFWFNICHRFDILHPFHPTKPSFWCTWISVHTKTTILLRKYYSKNKEITRTIQPTLFFNTYVFRVFKKVTFASTISFCFLGKQFTDWYTFMYQPSFYLLPAEYERPWASDSNALSQTPHWYEKREYSPFHKVMIYIKPVNKYKSYSSVPGPWLS